jgi:hypothetical protein
LISFIRRIIIGIRRRRSRFTLSNNDLILVRVAQLRLILNDFIARHEKASSWTSFAGGAAALWLNLIVSDFSPQKVKFFLNGEQWQVVYIISAAFMTFKAFIGLWSHVNRPNVRHLINDIQAASENATETRAIVILKQIFDDHQYRVLVYKDVVWDCYLLPHTNIIENMVRDLNDPGLLQMSAAILSVEPGNIQSYYLSELDLESRKYSEFHMVQTKYRFEFHNVCLKRGVARPAVADQMHFEQAGREFRWMTLSELEAHEPTRKKNIDVIRHIFDHSDKFFQSAPDLHQRN